MTNRTANLLGVLAHHIHERVEATNSEILGHSGETAAALIVIGYDHGPPSEAVRSVLGLSHPGMVRLVDRLVADRLVERRQGKDARTLALYLTDRGHQKRKELLNARLAAIGSIMEGLSNEEEKGLSRLLERLLICQEPSDLERRQLCRLCAKSVCENCPIPADF